MPDIFDEVAKAGGDIFDEVAGSTVHPSVSLGEITTGEDWQGDPSTLARRGLPIAAGIAGGVAGGPIGGLLSGPLAASITDIALGRAYGEQELPEDQRETSFLTDTLTGIAPSAIGAGVKLGAKLVPKPITDKISSAIRHGIEKGIRPSVSGKSNFAQSEAYFDRAESAVKTIIGNKGALKYTDGTVGLPKNLNNFSEAIDQSKRIVFDKYDDMLRASQVTGRGITLDDIGKELGEFSTNRVNQLAGGTGLKYSADKASEYTGELTLVQAQELIAKLNARQKAFLRNPTPDQASSAAVDAFILNRLRAKVDSAVEQSGYSVLKKQYGALRDIEKEVSNRAMVDARKNVKGLLDFSDIYTTTEMLHAMATMNPASGFFAVTMRGMKEYYKRLNDPNTIIRKMFADVDSLLGKHVPKEMKALPPGAIPLRSGVPDTSGITVKTGPKLYQKELPPHPYEMGTGKPDTSGLLKGGQEIVHGEPTDYIDLLWNKSADRYGGQFEYIPPPGKPRPYLRDWRKKK